MANILLKRTFISKGARRFRRDPRGTFIPDELCWDAEGNSLLPSDAKNLDDEALTAEEEKQAKEATRAKAKPKPTALSELNKKTKPVPGSGAVVDI